MYYFNFDDTIISHVIPPYYIILSPSKVKETQNIFNCNFYTKNIMINSMQMSSNIT